MGRLGWQQTAKEFARARREIGRIHGRADYVSDSKRKGIYFLRVSRRAEFLGR